MLSALSPFRRILIFTGYWLLWLLIHTYVLMDLGTEAQTAFLDSLVSNLFFAAGSLLMYITLRYYQPGKENTFYLRLWVVLLALANTTGVVLILKELYADNSLQLAQLEKSVPIRFCYQALMLAFVTLLQWMSNYLKDLQSLEVQKKESDRLAREAELYNLRQQLQPHFLFNSLNSISALAGSKPQEARTMIQQLSEFLRHTLRKDEQQLITLEEELHQLDLYLSIEKVRFGNRLRSHIEVDESCRSRVLPGLILQPLVENAIKFGLYDTLGEVEIRVKASCAPGELRIAISNPFDPAGRSEAGTGFGLDSIRRRLYLLYASNNLLKTHIESTTFTATITIPQA